MKKWRKKLRVFIFEVAVILKCCGDTERNSASSDLPNAGPMPPRVWTDAGGSTFCSFQLRPSREGEDPIDCFCNPLHDIC